MSSRIDFTYPTFAALSLDVYRDSNRPALPKAWAVFCDCPPEYRIDGYFGSCYLFIEANTGTIDSVYAIIAHRGTDNLTGEIEDFQMWARKKTPHQFQKAVVPFIEYVLNALNQKYPGVAVMLGFTGHSLGATLAELSMAYFGPNLSTRYGEHLLIMNAFTFESPGSKPLIQSMMASGYLAKNALLFTQQRLTVSNSDIDAINTCMEQTALCINSCEVGYSMTANSRGEYPLKPDPLYFFDEFTVKDQHSMSKMLDFWNAWSEGNKANFITCDQPEWPVGIKQAYKGYLYYDASNGFHCNYWNGYITRYWDAHPNLQSEGYENEEAFKHYFINHILPHHLSRAEFEIKNMIDRIENHFKSFTERWVGEEPVVAEGV